MRSPHEAWAAAGWSGERGSCVAQPPQAKAARVVAVAAAPGASKPKPKAKAARVASSDAAAPDCGRVRHADVSMSDVGVDMILKVLDGLWEKDPRLQNFRTLLGGSDETEAVGNAPRDLPDRLQAEAEEEEECISED